MASRTNFRPLAAICICTNRRSTPRRRQAVRCFRCAAYSPNSSAPCRDRVNTGIARARANGVKFGRGNRKDGSRSADEERWGMSSAAMHKRIKQLHKGGMGMLKIGRELGVGTGFVQRVLA